MDKEETFMKLYRNAIILTLVLAILVGAYVFLRSRENAGNDGNIQTDSNTISILELEKDKITEITLENESGRMVFVKTLVEKEKTEEDKEDEDDKEDKDDAGDKKEVEYEEVWVASEPEGMKINQSKIGSITYAVSSLDATKLIEENASDLAQYGLDKPATISVKLENNEVKTVEIGNRTPSDSGYYVKLKGESKVYVISSYDGGLLRSKYNDVRDKTLFTETADDITEFSLERGGKTAFKTKKTGENEWKLTEPIEASVKSGSIETILQSFMGTNASEFVERDASDLSKYGLDSPKYAIGLGSSKGTTTILLGNEKTKGSEIYAKFADSNEVFVLYESALNFIDKPLKEVVDVFAYITNISDVEKIVVEMDGQTVVSEIKTDPEDSDNDKFYVNGRDVSDVRDSSDSQLFRKYYQGLIGITMSELDIGAVPQGEPEITFTYYRKKDPKEVKVEFIPRDDIYYYVVRNGQYTNIIVAKDKFDAPDGPRQTYKNLMEAADKAKDAE